MALADTQAVAVAVDSVDDVMEEATANAEDQVEPADAAAEPREGADAEDQVQLAEAAAETQQRVQSADAGGKTKRKKVHLAAKECFVRGSNFQHQQRG